jgi:hypothetical protein
VLGALAAYGAFVVLALLLPALALLRLLRLPVEPAALVPLGLGLCAAAHALSLAASAPWLFPGLLGGVVVAGLARGGLGGWRCVERPGLRGALAPGLALVALFALTQYPLNRCTADGGFALDTLERVDTAFHVAVSWELTHSWPPQVPGLAGVPLDYHFGPHLVRAAAWRWAGIHPYDALARFDLTLWSLALVLAWRSAAQALGASPRVVALVPWTLLLTDAAWLASGWARGAWLTELLGGNLLVSLFFANALVPALATLLAALAALARAEHGHERAWRTLAALLGLLLPFFKVFLGLHFLGSLGLAWVLARGRRRELVWVAAPCLAAVGWLASGSGADSVRVLLRPLDVVQETRAALGLEAVGGWTLGLSSLTWLVLALGVRSLGLPAAWRALRAAPAPEATLAAMALAGFPLRLLLRISADGQFDEAVYFSVQSGALLWFHALGAGVVAWERRRSWLARAGLLVLAAAALPTTVDFVARKARAAPEQVPPGVMHATAWLARNTAPGEVVLTPSFSRYPPAPAVFIGRRVPYAEYLPYLTQFAPAALVAERERAVRRFFKHADPQPQVTATALGARYVALFGREAEVERWPGLESVYAADGVRVYRLRGSARPE